jgi:hypothetical protein
MEYLDLPAARLIIEIPVTEIPEWIYKPVFAKYLDRISRGEKRFEVRGGIKIFTK